MLMWTTRFSAARMRYNTPARDGNHYRVPDERRQPLTGGGQDWLKVLASRMTPAGQLVDRIGLLGDLLAEVEKRLTGLDELERRVDELERRIDELSKPAQSGRTATAGRKRRSTGARSQPKN
jgi:hypothetical protein